MLYDHIAIPDSAIPAASSPIFEHVLQIYSGETNKVVSVWRQFSDGELAFRPDARSGTVVEIMKHQLLSERRFFAEFLGAAELPAAEILPPEQTVAAFIQRMVRLATPRLAFLASRPPEWWLEPVHFFDVKRQRVWIFWRRVLHTAHHRTQLAVYLRLLGKPVPSIYGPTADISWQGADPTISADAASRK